MQVGQEEVAHLRVALPDARGHDGDGEGCFVVGRHLLLPLFLEAEGGKSWSEAFAEREPTDSPVRTHTTNFSANLKLTNSRLCGCWEVEIDFPPDSMGRPDRSPSILSNISRSWEPELLEI